MRVRPARGARGDGDDAAAAALLHGRQEGLDREEGGEVDVDRGAPVFLADVLDGRRAHRASAGVGHQHVRRSRRFLCLLTKSGHGAGIGQVGGERHRVGPRVGDLVLHLGQRAAIPTVQHDGGSVLGEQHGDGSSDPAGAAGHQRDPAPQFGFGSRTLGAASTAIVDH
jgi:hypothetical protein